jgi:hypothetical protein
MGARCFRAGMAARRKAKRPSRIFYYCCRAEVMTPPPPRYEGTMNEGGFDEQKKRSRIGCVVHGESGAEIGDCYAPICRPGDCFARAARSAGIADPKPLDTPTVGLVHPHDTACGRWCWCARECPRTRCVAKDGAVLAQTVAAGSRRAVRARAANRCAAVRSPRDTHPGADLRGDSDDLRKTLGQRAADQPFEPTRHCRRSDTTWPGAKHIAALSGAFFRKESDLNPHRVPYWLTPKPDPAFQGWRATSARNGRIRWPLPTQ